MKIEIKLVAIEGKMLETNFDDDDDDDSCNDEEDNDNGHGHDNKRHTNKLSL